MTFAKTPIVVSVALLLASAPLAFAVDSGAMSGSSTTPMKKTGTVKKTSPGTSTGYNAMTKSSGTGIKSGHGSTSK